MATIPKPSGSKLFNTKAMALINYLERLKCQFKSYLSAPKLSKISFLEIAKAKLLASSALQKCRLRSVFHSCNIFMEAATCI